MESSSSTPTIVSEKTHFLRRQARILSENVNPSPKMLEKAKRDDIPENVVRDVVLRVNRELKRHSRIVYSDMSIRHVADQIDALYWNAAEPDLEIRDDWDDLRDDAPLRVGDDLSLDRNIAKLPTTWDIFDDPDPLPDSPDLNQDDYTEALARLQSLSAQRLTLQQKLNSYRTLLSLLQPYRNPEANVQPNLVTRDAPLAAEFAKTQILAIRVAGRIGEKFGPGASEKSQDAGAGADESEGDEMVEDTDSSKKLQGVLASW